MEVGPGKAGHGDVQWDGCRLRNVDRLSRDRDGGVDPRRRRQHGCVVTQGVAPGEDCAVTALKCALRLLDPVVPVQDREAIGADPPQIRPDGGLRLRTDAEGGPRPCEQPHAEARRTPVEPVAPALPGGVQHDDRHTPHSCEHHPREHIGAVKPVEHHRLFASSPAHDPGKADRRVRLVRRQALTAVRPLVSRRKVQGGQEFRAYTVSAPACHRASRVNSGLRPRALRPATTLAERRVHDVATGSGGD